MAASERLAFALRGATIMPTLRCMAGARSNASARVDGPATEALLKAGRFFTRWDESDDGRAVFREGGRARRRLLPGPLEPRQGRAVDARRELHRLVLVEGLRQGRHHHLGGPADRLPLAPAPTDPTTSRAAARAAPPSPGTPTPPPGSATRTRAASSSRCTARRSARLGDPVLAWADVVGDPERRRRYQQARGKGGLVRVSWDEAVEMVAAAHVHTIKTYGPDRCAGFSPIPAMSIVSHCVGTRFIQLIGGVMTSFYDWYADLPVASPQVFGDQTDVPESGDWWDATYLMMWGSNVPVTRTPDAHWMAEVRYRGTKVVTVSPGLRRQHQVRRRVAARPGRHRRGAGDGDGPRDPHASTSSTARCRSSRDYVRTYTDLPFLVRLSRRATARYVPGEVPHRRRPLRARRRRRRRLEDGAARRARPASRSCRTARWASATPTPASAGGTSTSTASPRCCRCAGDAATRDRSRCCCPASRHPTAPASVLRRGVPARRVGGHLVTTVFDLMLAQYGVGATGLPGDWPTGYDDATHAVHAGLAGGDHQRPGRRRASGSPASSRPTPRSPAAAR